MATALPVELLREVRGRGGRVQSDAGTDIEGHMGRGLHSFTSQLNLNAFYGIGGARRDCVARVKGVLGGVYGV